MRPRTRLGYIKWVLLENHCVHYRIFHYNFVSPGTHWDSKCESLSKKCEYGTWDVQVKKSLYIVFICFVTSCFLYNRKNFQLKENVFLCFFDQLRTVRKCLEIYFFHDIKLIIFNIRIFATLAYNIYSIHPGPDIFLCVWIWLCWSLTTHQPLWVILCRLPEKGRRETGDSRGDEREG